VFTSLSPQFTAGFLAFIAWQASLSQQSRGADTCAWGKREDGGNVVNHHSWQCDSETYGS